MYDAITQTEVLQYVLIVLVLIGFLMAYLDDGF